MTHKHSRPDRNALGTMRTHTAAPTVLCGGRSDGHGVAAADSARGRADSIETSNTCRVTTPSQREGHRDHRRASCARAIRSARPSSVRREPMLLRSAALHALLCRSLTSRALGLWETQNRSGATALLVTLDTAPASDARAASDCAAGRRGGCACSVLLAADGLLGFLSVPSGCAGKPRMHRSVAFRTAQSSGKGRIRKGSSLRAHTGTEGTQ